jgi:hypothetical protein
VQAAFNVLKGQVDTFNARIATLESWKPGIDSAIASLQGRVASLEATVSWLANNWRPWAEASINSLNSRVGSLESRPNPGWDYADCYQNAGWFGADVGCNNGYVVRDVCSSGKNPDCGGNFTRVTCCRIAIHY